MGKGIDGDFHLRANLDVAQLLLAVVGDDPTIFVADDADQVHPGLDKLAFVDGLGRGVAVARRGDDGIGEVEFGKVERGFGDGDASVVLVEALGLLALDEAGALLLLLHGLVISFHGLVLRPHAVKLGLGDGLAFVEVLVAEVVGLGVFQAYFHLAQAGVADGDVVLRGADAGAHGRLADGGVFVVGLCLSQLQTELGIFNQYQSVAFLDVLELVETNLLDEARNLAADGRNVLIDLGIVGIGGLRGMPKLGADPRDTD